ncbi:MAG: Peptide methionine sulfoxide reductase MsrA [Candidatus Heimdallarchaeota archaeon AB_125]|nr:MAG: Peptide methionine sulfoxide reductase MsrA [Candidatus Heimdallarchaeota archaeon AB_125]
MTDEKNTETVTLGGGCFWCIEAVFSELNGVQTAESGYSGGKVDDPTYEQVCSGSTGHAEVVQVQFNSEIISFREILEIFFSVHDPTTLNRQGNDIGSQYRSVILYHSEEQREVAQKVITELNGSEKWKDSIVTELTAFDKFYKAEEYHQNYFKLNASQPYCKVVIEPKVTKFRKLYLNQLKQD